MKTVTQFEIIALLRKQLDDLEWLLGKAGYSPVEWDLQIEFDDGEVPTMNCDLVKRSNELRSISTIAGSEKGRHFFIDGVHSEDQFAIDALKESQIEKLE